MIGGMGDYTACLASALQGLGLQVSILTSKRAEAAQDAFSFPVLAQVTGWSFGAWGAVHRALEYQVPEIVHVQYQAAAYGLHPAINLLPLYLRLRTPTVRTFVTFHDLKVPYMFPKAGPLRNWAVRSLARRCQGVICTDEADLRVVSKWSLKSPAHLIPIGSNIPIEAPWTGGPQRGDSFVLGYFGLLNRSKGVETLLRAFRLLRQRGLAMTLVMVGADLGDSDPTNMAYAQRVRGIAGELDVDRAIRWTGHLSAVDTSRALQGLDLCVLPYLDGASFRRGTLMAALAHGLPIITTTPVSIPTSGPRLTDGENCRLVPPGDVGALTQAIEEVAGSPSLRETLGRGALALSRSFAWEEIGRKTVSAYEEVLSRRDLTVPSARNHSTTK